MEITDENKKLYEQAKGIFRKLENALIPVLRIEEFRCEKLIPEELNGQIYDIYSFFNYILSFMNSDFGIDEISKKFAEFNEKYVSLITARKSVRTLLNRRKTYMKELPSFFSDADKEKFMNTVFPTKVKYSLVGLSDPYSDVISVGTKKVGIRRKSKWKCYPSPADEVKATKVLDIDFCGYVESPSDWCLASDEPTVSIKYVGDWKKVEEVEYKTYLKGDDLEFARKHFQWVDVYDDVYTSVFVFNYFRLRNIFEFYWNAILKKLLMDLNSRFGNILNELSVLEGKFNESLLVKYFGGLNLSTGEVSDGNAKKKVPPKKS